MWNSKGWRKTWTIATFEFLTAVRRPGYLITTFGMPLFMAAYGAGPWSLDAVIRKKRM